MVKQSNYHSTQAILNIFVAPGVPNGTPAVTTRGMREPQMARIAAWIDRAVTSGGDEAVLANIREEVREFCTSFPLPH